MFCVDPDSLCTVYNMTGFYCSRTVDGSASAVSYVMCANGVGEKMECPPGEICSADGFTQGNPCAPIPPNSSVCGDGILGPNEDCERDGFGCDATKCMCKSGYYPSDPKKVDCLCKTCTTLTHTKELPN